MKTRRLAGALLAAAAVVSLAVAGGHSGYLGSGHEAGQGHEAAA